MGDIVYLLIENRKAQDLDQLGGEVKDEKNVKSKEETENLAESKSEHERTYHKFRNKKVGPFILVEKVPGDAPIFKLSNLRTGKILSKWFHARLFKRTSGWDKYLPTDLLEEKGDYEQELDNVKPKTLQKQEIKQE